MRKKIKPPISKYETEILSFFIAFAVYAVFLTVSLIFTGRGYSGGDSSSEYIPFLIELSNKMKSGGSIFYSRNGAGGYDFWSGYAYYLASPLNLLSVFLPVKAIPYYLNILICLKNSLCGATFSHFLRVKYGGNSFSAVLFSLLFSLSGFMLAYGQNLMWFDSIALFPLILLAIDRLISDNKIIGYVLLLAAAIWCNYYSGFIVCIGTAVYFVSCKFTNFEDFFRKGIKWSLCSVLSVLLCAVMLFPSVLMYKELGSFTAGGEVGFFGSFSEALHTLFFMEAPEPININSSGSANMYYTVFGLVLALSFFFSKSFATWEKVRYGVLMGFFIISMNLGVLNYIWHGFRFQMGIPNRFSYILIMLLITMSWRMYRENELQQTGVYLKGASAAAAVLVFVALCGKLEAYVVIVNFALVAVYGLLLCIKKYSAARRVLMTVMPLIGICVMLWLTPRADVVPLTAFYDETQELAGDIINGAYRVRFGAENTVERYETDGFDAEKLRLILRELREDGGGSPENLFHALPGLSFTTSYTDADYSLLMSQLGALGGRNYTYCESEVPLADMLFSVGYVMNHYAVSSPGCYEVMGTCGNTQLLSNKYALSLGYVVPEAFAVCNALKMTDNLYVNCNRLSKLICGEGVYELLCFTAADGNKNGNFGSASVDNMKKDSELRLETAVKHGGSAYLCVHAPGSVKNDVYVNGEKYIDSLLGDSSVYLGELTAGDTITVCCTACSDIESGSITICGGILNSDVMQRLYSSLSDEQLDITFFDDNTITGRITVKNDGSTLFFPITGRKGMKIYVDGIDTEFSEFNGCFMYIEIQSGTHEIKLEYITPGFAAGLAVSLASAVALIVFAVFEKRKRR